MRPKTLAFVVLGTLVLESLLVIGFVMFWPTKQPVSSKSLSTLSVKDTEEVLKEKLDGYSKRADDLQRLVSILLTLTTIYAIVLAVSAYASVQDNLKRADKSIDELAKLKKQHQEFIEKSRETQREELARLRDESTYSRRIAIATLISQLPFEEEKFKELREATIQSMLLLREGNWATDRTVNQQLAHLYRTLERFRSAEAVMTSLIGRLERKERMEKDDESALTDAYYDRAVYQSLRWASASHDEQTVLRKGIEADLGRAFRADDNCRLYAQKDDDFKVLERETWFQNLIRD